jgi:arylsulfatase A-like enzyme
VPAIIRWPESIKPAVADWPLVNTDWLPTLLSLAGLPAPAGLDGVNLADVLTGAAKPAERKFYWHFPHYNNQGGRPAGAIRDGDWKFITWYDTGVVEMYNLKEDVGETKNLAPAEIQRWTELDTLHRAWRKEVGAQENETNPDFDASLFKRLYEDFDPSRPPLAKTAAEMEVQMKSWRELMNEVVRGDQGGKKKK